MTRFHGSWPLALTTALAVVIAGLTLPQPEAQAAEKSDSAPALESQATIISEPVEPTGDFAPPSPSTSRSDAPDEVEPAQVEEGVDRNWLTLESRSEYQNVFVDGDGAEVVQLSPTPLNAKNDEGKWTEISTSFENSSDGWGADLHPLAPRIDENRNGGRELVIEREGHEVSLSLLDADAGDWESPFWFWDDWSTVAARGISEHEDIEFQVTKSSVRDSVILNEAPGDRRFRGGLETPLCQRQLRWPVAWVLALRSVPSRPPPRVPLQPEQRTSALRQRYPTEPHSAR